MDMKVQGSRSGKALGIGELLTSACSASALHWIDHSLVPRPFEEEEKGPGYEAMIDRRYHTIIRRRKAQAAVLNIQIIKICRVASCCQQ